MPIHRRHMRAAWLAWLVLGVVLGAGVVLLVTVEDSSQTPRGSGVSGEQTRVVSAFSGVELVGSNIVTVGGPRSVIVRGDDNLLSHVTTSVRFGRLTIAHRQLLPAHADARRGHRPVAGRARAQRKRDRFGPGRARAVGHGDALRQRGRARQRHGRPAPRHPRRLRRRAAGRPRRTRHARRHQRVPSAPTARRASSSRRSAPACVSIPGRQRSR